MAIKVIYGFTDKAEAIFSEADSWEVISSEYWRIPSRLVVLSKDLPVAEFHDWVAVVKMMEVSAFLKMIEDSKD